MSGGLKAVMSLPSLMDSNAKSNYEKIVVFTAILTKGE